MQSNKDELCHYGVLGMKWGQRRAKQYRKAAGKIDAKIEKKKAAGKILNNGDGAKIDQSARFKAKAKALSANRRVSNKEYKKNARAASNKAILDAIDYNAQTRYNKKISKANARLAKDKHNLAIEKVYAKYDNKANLGERLLFSNGTRRRAAKYVVDNKMSMKEASKKAKGEAVRNTGIALAAIGGMYLIEKKLRD